MKNIKEAAAVVGAIAGIAVGIDKTLSIIRKWRDEYDQRRAPELPPEPAESSEIIPRE